MKGRERGEKEERREGRRREKTLEGRSGEEREKKENKGHREGTGEEDEEREKKKTHVSKFQESWKSTWPSLPTFGSRAPTKKNTAHEKRARASTPSLESPLTPPTPSSGLLSILPRSPSPRGGRSRC
jgi:hypothetical protein